jgi:FixJ family two-component response regulator
MNIYKTVGLVDDDSEFLLSLRRLLDSYDYQVKTWSSAISFMTCPFRETIDCLIVDLDMPEMNGLDLQKTLAEEGTALQILFLTGKGDIPTSVRAIKSGALDFLTKPISEKELIPAIEIALVSAARARAKREQMEIIKMRYNNLTPREKEVIRHLISGKLNKQIAADFGITLQTIKVHRMRILAKMGVRSVTELVPLVELLSGDSGGWH